jgi:prepilin-type N-terminal cleavage/methylation domain-containing protein
MRKTTTMKNDHGFTLVEVLVAAMILTVALLTLATMFPTGYKQIADAGRLTLATNGANHILEDLGSVPFTSVRNLNNFDTNSAGTSPAADPELAIARRWRYMLAGSGGGFSFTTAETTAWGSVTPFGGQAQVQIRQVDNAANVCPAAATTCRAVVTITVPSRPNPTTVTLSTILVRMF